MVDHQEWLQNQGLFCATLIAVTILMAMKNYDEEFAEGAKSWLPNHGNFNEARF
jgi:hypothetical protein